MIDFLEDLKIQLNPEIQKVLKHPFFKRLNSGELSKQQIQMFAIDYYFYCQCFPQLLGYAAAKIVDDETRMPIIKNLWEEHGEGDIRKSHRVLYTNFLNSLDLTADEIFSSKPSMSTEKYINDLLTICNNGTFLDVLALVGPGTEYFASQEFLIIYEGLSKYDFGRKLDLEYWEIHIEIDDHHSSETLNVIKPYLTSEQNKRSVFNNSFKTIELELMFWDELNKWIK